MNTSINAPRLAKGGIVLLDAGSGTLQRLVALQYNPDSLTRTLQAQASGSEGGDRADPQRLKGPPVETLALEAEIDATDQLEVPERHPVAVDSGIFPQLAALETIVYPASSQLRRNAELVRAGTLEIIPAEGPLALFVWSRSRVLPVRITEFSITEEAFDAALNPVRARIRLGMRVLSVSDVPDGHRAAELFMGYLQQKERFVTRYAGAPLSALGLAGLP